MYLVISGMMHHLPCNLAYLLTIFYMKKEDELNNNMSKVIQIISGEIYVWTIDVNWL